MKNGLTELVFILDCSGSMAGLEEDTVGGFNSMIRRQSGESGQALVSAVLFSHVSRVLYDRVPLDRIEPMTLDSYRVGGSTALLDAVGGAVHHIGNVHKYARPEDVPQHTLFVIMTDGMENASRFYDKEKVTAMIERQTDRYGWEFIFLGANMDAVQTAGSFGIRPERAVNFHSDSEGTRLNYQAVGEAIASVRSSGIMNSKWRQAVDEDYENRK